MALYQILSILLSPIIDLYLLFRKFKGKEDPTRFKERFGFASKIRPEGKLIWVHAASVGESNSIWPLINKILEINPKINVLFTSGTITSAAEIAKKLPVNVIHQFIPVDKFFAVKRFIRYWRPNFGIFVESEIWPNLINEAAKSGCRLALINGRVSKKSCKRWQFLSKVGFNILKNFSICFAQSKQDLERFCILGIKNSYFFGNLKSVCIDPKIDSNKLAKFKNAIGTRKIWLAASTHNGEEEMAIKIHQQLKKYYPDLLTVIAPRHPNRLAEIIDLIPSDLKFSVRSLGREINNSIDIYLADTMGELSLFYNAISVSLIGGSMFDNIGGHNPFEAIKAGSIPISGPYHANFEEVYLELNNNNACILARNYDELYLTLKKLMSDPDQKSTILENGLKVLETSSNLIEEIVNGINNYSKLV